MANWTHAICLRCWREKHPDKPGRDLRILPPNAWEKCCYCGGQGMHGIYVRDDPMNTVNCPGHNESD